jgi:hypothetical protein
MNIRIDPARTALTRFNRIDPCRIPHDIHRHDPDLIRVKMSRISPGMMVIYASHTPPDFEPGPYGLKTE